MATRQYNKTADYNRPRTLTENLTFRMSQSMLQELMELAGGDTRKVREVMRKMITLGIATHRSREAENARRRERRQQQVAAE